MSVFGSRVRMVPYLAAIARKAFGRFPRQCNLCGYQGSFHAFGSPPRFDARCPSCGSVERHRLFGLWLGENEARLAGKEVLHFAPEGIIQKIVRPLPRSYMAADLNPDVADIVLNIEEIELPDESVDVVICSHVLEHVDHKKSLRDLRRILRSDGLLLLMFPIVEGWTETYSNSDVVSPQDRELHFGQWDHVQYFGRQVRCDIIEAGFKLMEFTAIEPDVSRYGLMRGEKVFIAECSE